MSLRVAELDLGDDATLERLAALQRASYAVEAELDDEHHTGAPATEPFEELVRRLGRSEAQELALNLVHPEADGGSTGDLVRRLQRVAPTRAARRRPVVRAAVLAFLASLSSS